MEIETEEEVVHAWGTVHGRELHPRGIVGEAHLLQYQHTILHVYAPGDVSEFSVLIQSFLDGGVHVDIHSERYDKG